MSAPPAETVVRESRRVATIAHMLELDESQVRRLIGEGALEAHRIGKRGLRVYLDSVAAFQDARTRPATIRTPCEKTRAARRSVATAAHRRAMASLRADGLVP